ncbi:MAG: HAD family phosphatase [Lachnospiraceae bacterium]|nr:HAD family phosphatase [Lachnospiraceae bacterium]
MIKNIIFDIGNVLCAFRWREYFQEFGYSEEVLERLAKATALNEDWNEFDRGALTREEILQLFVENDPGIEKEIRETLTNIKNLLARYDYAVPWIQELKSKGYKCYYLSNFSLPAWEDCQHVLDFIPYMDGGILSYRDKVIKPSREIYELLMARYDLRPEECVFLDDTEKNILGAREAGLFGIMFENKEQAIKELRGLGVNA